jgi:hypothetical protein
MTKSASQMKEGAKRLRIFLKSKGIALSNSQALEAVSVYENYPNWDTACAMALRTNPQPMQLASAVVPSVITRPAIQDVSVAQIAEGGLKSLPQFVEWIDKVGYEAEERRLASRIRVVTRADITLNVPAGEGVYWIETNMPLALIPQATLAVTGRETLPRTTVPGGRGFTKPDENGRQVIYVGTQANMQQRLLQHLFNEGHDKTGKLRCVVDTTPFNLYEWYVSFCTIEGHSARYSIEAWWRLYIGWPPFCVR